MNTLFRKYSFIVFVFTTLSPLVTCQAANDIHSAIYINKDGRSGQLPNGITAVPHAVKWRFESQGTISSNPLYWSGKVYFGSDDGGFYAVDAKTGRQEWVYRANDMIRSAASFSSGTIYVGSADSYLYALNATDGTLQWKFQAENGILSSSTIDDHRIAFGDQSGNLYSLDRTTGTLLWKGDLGEPVYGLIGTNGIVCATTVDAFLHCLDSESGELLWASQGALSHPTVHGDFLLLPLGGRNGGVISFAIETGEKIWHIDLPLGWMSVATHDLGILFSYVDRLSLIDFDTGEIIWTSHIGKSVVASPISSGNVAYFSSLHSIHAVDINSGEELWAFSGDFRISTIPIMAEGRMYFGTRDGELIALE